MHILLITRHYPPEVSGGARRPSLFVKSIRELGHKVTVVTPFKIDDHDSIAVTNSSIMRGISALHQQHSIEKQKSISASFKASVKPWLYWPDDNVGWAQDVVRIVSRRNVQPDWIFTTSPPESVHIAGKQLSSLLNAKWLAEFRDTWIEMPHRNNLATSKVRRILEKRIAGRVLFSANALTAVSETVMDEARKYVKVGTPECIISHFSEAADPPFNYSHDKLNLVHTGGFSRSDRRRHLQPLINALERIYVKKPSFVFHIAGPLSSKEHKIINNSILPIEWHGSVSLTKSRSMQAGADGLILYTPENSHALPGKYAEYAMAGRPILVMGGGKWKELIVDDTALRPLENGILTLSKNEAICSRWSLSHTQAAKTLISFLNKIAPQQ